LKDCQLWARVQGDDHGAIKEAVASFTGGFGEEEAGVASRSMDELLWIDGLSLRAQRIG
jgi:hypothetical protein